MNHGHKTKVNRSKDNRPLHYRKITRETRIRIIEMVREEGQSFKNIGDEFGISPSTVRAIFRKYQYDGKVFEKKVEKRER